MKLIIQIPCYNEEETLPITLANLPRQVAGFETVEWLVIDDGSSDATVRIALDAGVDHVVQHSINRGLAVAFMTGINACLSLGADVIVNTDADNQYNADDIPLLTTALLENKADVVIGARPISEIPHFSWLKKRLQRLGSWSVRVASGTSVEDAPSGFRAYSKVAAQQIIVFSPYTYTLETIIQAGRNNFSVLSIPIRVNEDLRPSRLVKSIRSYVSRSLVTIVRTFVVYEPFRFFLFIGLALFSAGVILGLRFLWFWLGGDGAGHVQSVILSSALLVIGFQTCLVAFIADLVATNRKLLEDIRIRVQNEGKKPPNLISRSGE